MAENELSSSPNVVLQRRLKISMSAEICLNPNALQAHSQLANLVAVGHFEAPKLHSQLPTKAWRPSFVKYRAAWG